MYHVIKLNHKNPEGNEMNFQGNLIQFTIAIMESVLADPNIGTNEIRRRSLGRKERWTRHFRVARFN